MEGMPQLQQKATGWRWPFGSQAQQGQQSPSPLGPGGSQHSDHLDQSSSRGPQVPRSPSTLPKSATNTAVFCFTRPGPRVRPRVSVQLANCPQRQAEPFSNVPKVTQEPAPGTTPAQTRSTIMAADIQSHCTCIVSLTPHNDVRKEESLPPFCRDSMTPEAT